MFFAQGNFKPSCAATKRRNGDQNEKLIQEKLHIQNYRNQGRCDDNPEYCRNGHEIGDVVLLAKQNEQNFVYMASLRICSKASL